jgi:hypothetical protein
MMSIVKQFGKENGKVPPLPRVVETPMPPNERHAQALEFVGSLAEENARLEDENRQLRQDGALALMRIRDLEREATLRFSELETNRRYAVEVQTHLQHVLDAATHAHHCAVNAAEAPLQLMPDAVHQAAAEVVEKELNAVKAGGDSG